MKTLVEFMEEPVFLVGPYVRTHGYVPGKIGSYHFSTEPNSDERDHEYHYYSTYTTYEKAKEQALKHFPMSKYIYVLA
jgi:hypothetical protein